MARENRGTLHPRKVTETTSTATILRAEYLDTPTGPILILTDDAGGVHGVR